MSAVQTKLSAGRCQTPALKLLYEKEKLISDFKSNKTFQINGTFKIENDIEATYIKELSDATIVKDILKKLINHKFKLVSVDDKLSKQNPPPPYITSTIQQDASSKLVCLSINNVCIAKII